MTRITIYRNNVKDVIESAVRIKFLKKTENSVTNLSYSKCLSGTRQFKSFSNSISYISQKNYSWTRNHETIKRPVFRRWSTSLLFPNLSMISLKRDRILVGWWYLAKTCKIRFLVFKMLKFKIDQLICMEVQVHSSLKP